MPIVSIITPAYNAARYIGEAATSVLSQDLTDWEWIIVDDGSTDETATRVAEINDDRIIFLSQKNSGVSVARNAALDRAKGTYVTFLDADDRLPNNSLIRRVALLKENPDVGIVNGCIRKFNESGDIDYYNPSLAKCPFFQHIAQLRDAVFMGPFYMIRRSTIGNHRFPTGISHCEDLIFFTELAHANDLIYAGVKECIYEYRLHPTSAMSNLPGIENGYYEFLRRTLPLTRMTPPMRRYLRCRISSILAKSWLRRGRPIRAFLSATKALFFRSKAPPAPKAPS